jgi:energy-coupling factor transporter ATP-binding protein EcfA2
MESGSGVDLFRGFNEVEVSEVLRRCTNCGRFVLIGPPRSGKTFFRENYLEGRLGAGVTVDEHTLGITTTTKTEGKEAKGGLGIPEKVVRLLKRMMPWIGKLVDEVRVKDEELRRILGDRAPRHVVEGARGMIGDSPHRAYYIPWKCVEEPSTCTFDADASRALGLIKEAFGDRRIRWFRAEYIPPGLVREVIELIREKGEGGAREVLEDWVDAYFEAIEALSKVLGLGENLLEWDELSIGFLSNFVNNLASYVIGGLATIPISAAALTLISVLTYMAFKRKVRSYVEEIIGLRRSLEGLLVKGPDGRLDFNELGRLLVYRVAYAMGMSYEEAKEALMDIADLSIEELERRVNEIEEKIKELEEKIKLFRQEVPAGIVTANVGEFAKGGIYPNIKVKSGKLRIRVEDEYYNVVRAGRFNELVSEIKDKLLKQGFVVVVGPKGIGKSTLAAAVIWELLMNNDIGLIARVDVLDSKNYSEFTTFIENYGKEFSEHFGRLLILYDLVSTETYERADIDVKAPIQTSIEKTVNNLMNIVNVVSSEASKPLTLIVIPSDFYNALSGEVRSAVEVYRLDVSQALSDREFLAELIREYTRTKDNPNGCALSDRELNELAGKLAKFDSDHALIARLIGEELARNNCSASEVEELINNAKGRAETFIIQYINKLFKVHKNPNTAKVLVEVFALRKPFVNSARPGEPILTPGVIELIGKKRGVSLLYSAEGKELRGWLARRQHDLIEEAIEELLDCIASESEECKDLKDTLRPWKTIGVMETLREVSEKVNNVDSAVKYFASSYGEKLTNTLKLFSNCWKRAALIIGAALVGHPIVPRPEGLRKSVVESLGDALNRCEIDDYLLVGNLIPPLIWYLIKNHTHALTEAFVDKYGEAVAEVRRVLGIARDKGSIYDAEKFYGLGLASIIANAAGSNKPIKPSDADAALRVASFTMLFIVSPDYVKPVLRALEPLRDYAPHRYLELLAHASNMTNLDRDTVRYIFDKLNEILDNYGDAVKEHAWSLVYAIDAYAYLLWLHRSYFNREEVGDVVGRVADLLNELGRFSPSLGVIAWAYALDPALRHEKVRRLMEEALGIDVVDKASEVLGRLNKLRDEVQELMRDEEFMDYVESRSVKANEEAVKKEILEAASTLKHALAHYRLGNDELDKAKELFNAAAKESKEIGDYENDLIARGLALRVEAIKDPLVGDELVKLVDGFRQLYEETFNEEHFEPTALYLSNASTRLGEYLVSLALAGDHETISKLLEKHWWVLNADEQVSVLTRLTLNALLRPRGGLSGELEGKLVVEPRELINAFGPHMYIEFLPALMVAFGVIKKPEDVGEMCVSINDSIKRRTCRYAISVAMNDNAAVVLLRGWLIDTFRELLLEKLGLLKELGADADVLFNEFMGLVYGLDGKSLVQLLAPGNSMAQFVLMLHALVNGNEKLAKALALYGAVVATGKPSMRLFLETYRACCDLGSEEFRRAVAKLFFLHV